MGIDFQVEAKKGYRLSDLLYVWVNLHIDKHYTHYVTEIMKLLLQSPLTSPTPRVV